MPVRLAIWKGTPTVLLVLDCWVLMVNGGAQWRGEEDRPVSQSFPRSTSSTSPLHSRPQMHILVATSAQTFPWCTLDDRYVKILVVILNAVFMAGILARLLEKKTQTNLKAFSSCFTFINVQCLSHFNHQSLLAFWFCFALFLFLFLGITVYTNLIY